MPCENMTKVIRKTLINNMLKIENELEIPTESNYYHIRGKL